MRKIGTLLSLLTVLLLAGVVSGSPVFPKTYGQDKVAFVYAQPMAELVEGLKLPQIKNAKSVKLGALAVGE